MGPYRVDPQDIYHEQPYARVNLNLCQSRLYPPSQGLMIWPLGSLLLVVHEHVICSVFFYSTLSAFKGEFKTN
jgi:hypothetical protein